MIAAPEARNARREIALLTHADTDLATLSRAAQVFDDAHTAVRGISLHTVASADAMACWLDTLLTSRWIVMVRLLGRTDEVPGLAALSVRAREADSALVALSGIGEADPELDRLSNVPVDILRTANAYWQAGGVDNIVQCLRYLSDRLFLTKQGYQAPRALPKHGVYCAGLSAADAASLIRRTWRADWPSVGVLFYRAHWISGNLHFIDALINALAQRRLNVLPVFTHSLRDSDDSGFPAALRQFKENGSIDVLINTTSFATGDTNPGRVPDKANQSSVFKQLDVPVLQAITSGMTREQWERSARGLNPLDTAMNVALPEFDARLIGVPLSFKAAHTASSGPYVGKVIRYEALIDRVERIAGLADRLARLSSRACTEKRIAFVLTNASGKAAQIGNAVGLDAPASLLTLLRAMQARGYQIGGLPDASDRLMQTLIQQGSYDEDFLTADQMRNAHARVPLSDYTQWFNALPDKLRDKMQAQWGAPPGAAYADDDGSLIIAGLEFGNVFVALQPPRGYGMDPDAIYHQPDLPPTHHYYAFYCWLRDIWRADAIIHVGKHGTLEWLPGKGVGLSEQCFPDALLADMPLFYPFIVNDPGEGSQAKRRAHAVIIDHLMPPMTTADTYGSLAQLAQLVDEYYRVEALDPVKLPLLQRQICDLIKHAKLDADLDLLQPPQHARDDDPRSADAEIIGTDFARLLEKIDGYLCELSAAQIRDGLHTLGAIPTGDALIDLICALTRIQNPTAPSLPASVAHAFDIDWNALQANQGKRLITNADAAMVALQSVVHQPLHTHADVIEAILALSRTLIAHFHAHHFDNALIDATITTVLRHKATEPLRELMRFISASLVPNLQRTQDEIDHLLHGLDGGYVPAGPSGAPTRGMAHVLPTGRNFYSVDPRAIPSMAAAHIGERLANEVLCRHLDENGCYPESVGISVWGTSTMRTQGDDIAEVLALLGVKPIWQAESRRVTGFEVIPLAALGRPRIDVTVRISGFFRDAFAHLIELVDAAIQHVAQLDEPFDANYVRKHYLDEVRSAVLANVHAETAKRRALYRIFGARPGSYGAGILPLIQQQNWQSRDDFARAYLEWGGYVYTRNEYGVEAHDALRTRLRQIDIALHNQDNREHDIFDSDDYMQFHGGMIAAIHSLTGRQPRHYFGDTHDPARPCVRDLKQEALRVFRARVVNPKWLDGIQRHGYKGGLELSATVDYLFGYDATADILDDWIYEDLAQAYALDANIKRFLAQSNPWALHAITERLLEAVQRGMWRKPAAATLRALMQQHLESEALLEARDE